MGLTDTRPRPMVRRPAWSDRLRAISADQRRGDYSMKKLDATLAVLAALAIPTAAPAANNASDCGAAHGAFANVNGNFGFLGEAGGTPGYHGGATGQDAGATGYNNSHTGCQG